MVPIVRKKDVNLDKDMNMNIVGENMEDMLNMEVDELKGHEMSSKLKIKNQNQASFLHDCMIAWLLRLTSRSLESGDREAS